MAKKPRQKLKLLYLMKILLEKTDESHGLSTNEIISLLEEYGISAERKSLYDDISTLELFGMDICKEKTKTVRYYVASRDFQISELKLLVDAIQSSKFITEKKSLELIKKLESLASENEALLLQNQVIVSNRVKTENETIYYNVDRLHDAISGNSSVTFYYNKWVLRPGNPAKIELERRHSGKRYRVSPWVLRWDDENYYLIAFDEHSGKLKHYRVDKMENIELTGEKREGKAAFDKTNVTDYAKATFSMYGGEPCELVLSVHNDLIGVIADRFGKNIHVEADPGSAERFRVRVRVNMSNQFFGWLFAFGNQITIIKPESVRQSFAEHCRSALHEYEEAEK